MATFADLRNRIELSHPNCVASACFDAEQVFDIRYTASTSEMDKAAVQNIIDTFDWNAPSQSLPLFYDLLVQAVLTGLLPEDVVSKAELVNKILDTDIRNQAILGLASNPLYSQAQIDVFVAIANQAGVSLPVITANPNAPNLSAFITTVWGDQTIPGNVRMLIGEKEDSFKKWIAAGPLGAQVILDAWAIIKEGLDAIDPAIATKIEVHAAAHNVPIV